MGNFTYLFWVIPVFSPLNNSFQKRKNNLIPYSYTQYLFYKGNIINNWLNGKISSLNVSEVLQMSESTSRVHFKIKGKGGTVIE